MQESAYVYKSSRVFACESAYVQVCESARVWEGGGGRMRGCVHARVGACVWVRRRVRVRYVYTIERASANVQVGSFFYL